MTLQKPGQTPVGMSERHAFQLLLPQHTELLRRRALKLTGNAHRAEDLVQDTLLKAWANRDRYRPDTGLRPWLFTILRNTFLSGLRKSRREVEDIDDVRAGALSEEPAQEHALALKELICVVARLPLGQRRALVLVGAYGFSQVEAANACKCTIGTIKSRVSRARATLGQVLAPDEKGHPAQTPHVRIVPGSMRRLDDLFRRC
ncbi:sigma-70 family RNA polymerase sigma factor [Roseovarius tibetensis]|uniref:sigma-70 family RNA polymerase sigma factor n=1 Tax=Roseovarius tibetensis TaxID=2685897 RepID=UPI003D7F4A6B